MPLSPRTPLPLPRSWQLLASTLLSQWWCAALLLAIPILVIYHDVGRYAYLAFDDPTYITDNQQVLQGLSWETLRWALTTHHGSYWGPLTWWSFQAEVELFGAQASVSHWINVLLHLCNTWLLYTLLKVATRTPLHSLAVAMLFGIHPLHVESVAWVAERKDVLSAFWGFLTLLAYVRYCQQPSRWRYLLVIPGFGLAVCTKPLMVTLPVMMLLLDYWPLQRHTHSKAQTLLIEKIPFLMGSLLVASITADAQRGALLAHAADFESITAQLAHICTDYLVYVYRMLVPLNLAVFYPRDSFPAMALWIAAAGLLPLFSWYVFRQRHSQPYGLMGWLWYVMTLLPMSGIIVFGRNVMADRFTYIPSIGIFILLVWGLAAIPRIKKHLALPALVATFTLTYMSYQQASYWKNDFILFQRAVDVTTNNYLAYNNLGNVYLNRRQADEAAQLFEKANRVMPDHHEILNSLGLVYDLQGYAPQAEAAFRRDIEVHPAYSKPYVNLGSLLMRQGRYTEAIPLYEEAMLLSPASEKALNNLAALYLLTGQPFLSIDLLQRALILDPDNASIHYNLGYAYHLTGNAAQAITSLEQALSLYPDSADIRQLLSTVRGAPMRRINPAANENPLSASPSHTAPQNTPQNH